MLSNTNKQTSRNVQHKRADKLNSSRTPVSLLVFRYFFLTVHDVHNVRSVQSDSFVVMFVVVFSAPNITPYFSKKVSIL